MTFIKDLQFGKIGERKVIDIIERRFDFDVEDVSMDENWQKQDVDILLNGGEWKIEVKSDRTTTPNIFYETVSNSIRGTEGNMLYTTADLLFYVHYGHNVILTIPVKPLREWVNDNISDLREVSVRTSNAIGLLLPIKRVVLEVDNVGIMNMDGFNIHPHIKGWGL